MIYSIIFLMFVIIGTITFIGNTYATLLDLEHKEPFSRFHMPMIIEKVYRGMDFRYSFEYAKPEALDDFRFWPNQETKMIYDSEHKQHVLKEGIRHMADEMLKSGCIEVSEDSGYHPHVKRVEMKVKIYKPE